MNYRTDKNEEKRRIYREQYGKVIKRKRTGKNITQMELAEELGVARTTVSRYEKGKLEMPASLLPLISDICNFRFSDYMEDFDLVLLSKRLDEIDVYGGYARKASYPLPEWDVEYCRREREQLMEELKECLAQNNSSELVCLAKMFDALQVYKENGMSDSMKELEVRIVEQAKEEIRKFPGLYELVFKITVLTEVIDSGVNGSHY